MRTPNLYIVGLVLDVIEPLTSRIPPIRAVHENELAAQCDLEEWLDVLYGANWTPRGNGRYSETDHVRTKPTA